MGRRRLGVEFVETGSHPPGPGQWPEGSFYLKFDMTWYEEDRFDLEAVPRSVVGQSL
jgi:hypothetical protein